MWHGKFLFEPNRKVELRVVANKNGPTTSQSDLFLELPSRYPDILDCLQNELFRTYIDDSELEWPNFPGMRTPGDLWEHVTFDYVELFSTDHWWDLTFAFSVPWDEEHGRFIRFKEWNVVDVSM